MPLWRYVCARLLLCLDERLMRCAAKCRRLAKKAAGPAPVPLLDRSDGLNDRPGR